MVESNGYVTVTNSYGEIRVYNIEGNYINNKGIGNALHTRNIPNMIISGNEQELLTVSQDEWAIEKLGVSHLWRQKLNPMELIYAETGQKILFRGAGKPKKLVHKGYIRYIWYKEMDEFNGMEKIRTINSLFVG